MSNANEKETIIVQPDDSIILQIRINGVMLPPQILPLTAIAQLPMIANAQLSTFQAILIAQQEGATDAKTD